MFALVLFVCYPMEDARILSWTSTIPSSIVFIRWTINGFAMAAVFPVEDD